MPVNRKFWKNYYFVKSKDGVPPYPCPICHHGTLKLVGKILEGESGRSIRHKEDDDWDLDHYLGAFCCLLRCSNDHCGEYVSVSGRSDHELLGEDGDIFTVCLPRMFTPPLHLLSIPEECPKDVAGEFIDAFKLYWSDLPGALNHIRKAVELIMDRLKIPRKTRNPKGKSKRIDLHRRIDLFRVKNSALADRLEAVKWLGNVGSHSSEVTKDDFFNACDLLEDFIHQIFEKRGKKIVLLTHKIIKKFRKK